MNPSKNDITGDFIISGTSTNSYRSGWDLIWGNKKQENESELSKSDTKEVNKEKQDD